MATPRLAAARAILTEPRARVSAAVMQQLATPPQGQPSAAWHAYLASRGWLSDRFAAADVADQQAGLSILSTSLTFPLTVARHWPSLRRTSDGNEKAWTLCVVGSRAESTLPTKIWKELAVLIGVESLHVSFVGPKAAPPGVEAEREWRSPDGHTLRLSLPADGGDLFHRSKMGRALLKGALKGGLPCSELQATLPDAFVLFNPGTGEPGWEKAWAPTMRALSAAQRPLLMTALSTGDAARDAHFIAEHVDEAAAAPFRAASATYAQNPFASLAVAHAVDGVGAANYCSRVVDARPRS